MNINRGMPSPGVGYASPRDPRLQLRFIATPQKNLASPTKMARDEPQQRVSPIIIRPAKTFSLNPRHHQYQIVSPSNNSLSSNIIMNEAIACDDQEQDRYKDNSNDDVVICKEVPASPARTRPIHFNINQSSNVDNITTTTATNSAANVSTATITNIIYTSTVQNTTSTTVPNGSQLPTPPSSSEPPPVRQFGVKKKTRPKKNKSLDNGREATSNTSTSNPLLERHKETAANAPASTAIPVTTSISQEESTIVQTNPSKEAQLDTQNCDSSIKPDAQEQTDKEIHMAKVELKLKENGSPSIETKQDADFIPDKASPPVKMNQSTPKNHTNKRKREDTPDSTPPYEAERSDEFLEAVLEIGEEEDLPSSTDRFQCQRAVPYPEWAKLKSELQRILPSDHNEWTVEHVGRLIRSDSSLAKYSAIFEEHEIDGKAFILLTDEIMINHMGLKIGPVLKIKDLIEQIKHRKLDLRQI